MGTHNELGKKGEQIALKHLENLGYKVLEKNWFYQKAEIDLITQKENVLVVIEVKTRSSIEFGSPESFVSKSKIKLLSKAIDAYIEQNNLDLEVRFDIISIVIKNDNPIVEHIENAFYFF